jgi:hypothetical protein
MSDPEACKARVQELLPGQNFGNLTDENAKKILMLPQLAASDINPKPPIARIIEQLETVQSLAHEKRVSPEEIFLEDELYKEFVRRTTSVDEVAAKIVESMNNIDPKKIKQDMRNSHIATMHILGKEQLRDKEIDEADSPRETAETEQFVAKVRETIMSQGVAKIKRFWGKQEIKQLDPELQQELGFDKETERVATAMDKRNKRELQWMKNVVSRNTGSQLTDVTDGNSPLLIRETYTAILECFEKDEPEETFAQAVSDTVQEKLLEYEVDDAFRTDGDLEDKTKIVTFSASEIGSSLIGEKLQLLSKLSLGRVDSLTRSLPKADELAQQFFVPVEEVYENEKLYTELIRSTYASPEEYAQTRLAQLPELTYENFQRLEIVEGLLCYTNLDGREELERQELEESSTPKATARLDQRVAQAKRS